jgi:hypothetical protein
MTRNANGTGRVCAILHKDSHEITDCVLDMVGEIANFSGVLEL